MKYNFKEDYKYIFDTPAKRQQEIAVASKIMILLNANKYNDIIDFAEKNKTYQDFLKNNELENVVKHFGNILSEQDFKAIIEQIIKVTDMKKSYDKENIKTSNIEEKEYVSYEGNNKTFFLDNSNTQMTVERQLQELQKTEQKFQTTDTKQNTEKMMEELEKNKKEKLNLQYINQIDINKLTNNQKENFNVALSYQQNIPYPIRIDIDRGIIVDENNNIMRIIRNDGNVFIVGDNNEVKNKGHETPENNKKFQKTLMPSLNTIYSQNN